MDNLPASGRQTLARAGLVDVNGHGHNRLIDSGSGDRVSFVYIKFLSICSGFTQAARLEIECQLIGSPSIDPLRAVNGPGLSS